MAKAYFFKFGAGDPRVSTGLFPTFIIFSAAGLTAVASPAITEAKAGTGIYTFSYGPTLPVVAYLIDGAGSLSASDRYVSGVLDPVQAVDQQVGFRATDTFGTTVETMTLSGFFKRFMEQREGDQSYAKATGIWQIFNRGSSTLIRTKQLTDANTSSTATGSG